ncbi:hypothetical protein J4H86_16545 [Spiractinospora alimapuensis]|uniref:DUF6049 family protein n=1 Tax=Spiractinospora alimapuensis TaxID=2820884 RepID=UPI001F32F16F|nr:DUF6049 family protein [Spiractinospora alimapuensis]QVQ50513.1 hypothetical protein J4H86_16545 [Spiractinospora alimapuensis]
MRLFALIVAALSAFVVVATPAAGDPVGATDGETLTVDEITPQAVDPDDEITLNGSLANTTDEALDEVRIRLRYSSTPLQSREELADFAEGDRGIPQVFGPEWDADGSMEPGARQQYSLRFDADDLTLGGFGVYPIAVEAVDAAGQQLAAVRTFLPYLPDDVDVEPTQIAWVWPLMDRPHRADADTFLTDSLAQDVIPGGRLSRLLTAGEQGAPVTWAIDPGLLDDVDRLSGEGSQLLVDAAESPGPTGPSFEELEADTNAQLWLDQARDTLEGESILATPYANPDISALLAGGMDTDADAGVTLGRQTVGEVLNYDADRELAWPPNGHVDEETARFLVDKGADTILLRESVLPSDPWSGATHPPAVELPFETDEGEPAVGVVADAQLTSALSVNGQSRADSALALQRFSAETVMIAAEQPDAEQSVVAVPPTQWDPGPELATGVLEASQDLPWLDPVDLTDVADGAQPIEDTGRQGPEYGAGGSWIGGEDNVERMEELHGSLRLFNSILVDDEDPFRRSVLRLESAAWREDDSEAAQAMDRTEVAVEEATNDVRILPGEPVMMASKTGEAPILVANDLPYSVSVTLSVFSENSERLAVGDYTETMEIGPGSRTTVHVPLSATVNGRTLLHLNLHNPDGEPISAQETTQPVNVTGLGTSALLVSGAAAALLLALMLPRAIRKWRRTRTRKVEHVSSKEPGGD